MIIGIDVGGTKIEACVIGKSISANSNSISISHPKWGEIQVSGRYRVNTEREQGYDHILENISICVSRLLLELNLPIEKIERIGLGLPGSVDPKTGIMYRGNTQVLENHDVCQDLKRRLKFQGKVLSENDANCFALAETLCGAGVKYQNETGIDRTKTTGVGVILGTGCGGGIVINGTVLTGRYGSAGEVGHLELHEGGHPCYCGQRGCAENYVSGPALEAAFENRRNASHGGMLKAPEVFHLAEKGDPFAIAVVEQHKKDLGKLLSQVNDVLNPDFIVLGGGVSLQRSIYEGLEEHLLAFSFVKKYCPKIYQNVLGDSAGVIGAALMVWSDD